MIGPGTDCVIDASVGIKLFIAEEFSDNVFRLFASVAGQGIGEISVPDLFFVECANILWKHVRRFGYPAAKAQKDLSDLRDLDLNSHPTYALTPLALEIALAARITAYDACYVALAKRLDVPLITADERLAHNLSPLEYQVLWLGNLELPGQTEE